MQTARKTFTVDGESFSFLSLMELRLVDQIALARFECVMSWPDGNAMTEQQACEFGDAVDGFFEAIVIDGKSITDKLTDKQKVEVINVFSASLKADKSWRPPWQLKN